MIKTQASAKGTYVLSIKRESGETEELKFDNLILDIGIGSNTTNLFKSMEVSYIYLGSGTTPASVTDTALESQINSGFQSPTNPIVKTIVGATAEYSLDYTIVFNVGVVVGTVSEIGAGNPYGIFSRSLLTDIVGNPVSITLGAFDQLTVNYKLTIKIESFDFTTIINIKGTDRNCRLVSVNPGQVSYYNVYAYTTNTAYFYTESIGVITEGQTFLKGSFANIPKTGNSYNNSSDYRVATMQITLAPADVNDTIYAIGFISHTAIGNPLFLLIFDIPVTKTVADEIIFDIVISLDGVRA